MGIAVPSQLRKASHQLTWLSLDTLVLVLPATAGLVLVAGPPPLPSTGMDPSSAETVSTCSTAFARRRGLLSLRLTMVPSVTDMELLSHPLAFQFSPLSLLAHGEPLSPARPQLLRPLRLTTLLPLASVKPTLMPTTVMVAAMVPTPLGMGLAMAMADTDSATEATAMAVLATAMARGLLTPRLMPTMA